MFRTFRNVITMFIFVVLSAISLGTAGVVYWYRLPDPEIASGTDLFRWLVTRELANETVQTQQKMLRRVEAELNKPSENVDDLQEHLDPQRRAQLERNIEHLGKLWLQQKSATYVRLPAAEQEQYVDEQILQLRSLALFYESIQKKEGSPQRRSMMSDTATYFKVMSKVQAWIHDSEEDKQDEMNRFVSAMQNRVFKTFFGGQRRAQQSQRLELHRSTCQLAEY